MEAVLVRVDEAMLEVLENKGKKFPPLREFETDKCD